ncbi:dihydropteroate synthase [Brucepastera parasyntrophica]|uniref:dihydropteroate synthase n=1 Tax=Brucepastera parasyntrophica TaxID=2880008 RepID=UPI00210DA7D7|nr:dihydropteroate synthase [Brucepastera parasyntrophica]ULQ61131.1 dihydropteroate synthase [Brucepastera parasyntrophica]
MNPTGKKRFKEAILNNDIEYVLSEARDQIAAGAHVLDVNTGLPGIDEVSVMLSTVRSLQKTFPIPLQIDSGNPAVLEKAIRYYNGKPLINSVNGKEQVMRDIFPIVRKYGGVVIGLTLDENGIPSTAEGRLAIARKIVETAALCGIERKNIIIDALTLTISSQQKEAMEAVRALQLIKDELQVKTILGVSNISFGLPRRELINAAFLASALSNGLDACIINPLSSQIMAVYYAYRALAGFDENCLEYIEKYMHSETDDSATNAVIPVSKPVIRPSDRENACGNADLRAIIINGMKGQAREAAGLLLETKTPLEIIDEYIVPALDEVGKDFEEGRKFLPSSS